MANHMNTALSITSYGITDRGMVRQNNEDAFWKNDTLKVYAIADGLGGLPHGEVASTLAISSVEQALTVNRETNLADLFKTLNEAVINKGKELDPEGLGMGTTLTVGRIENDEIEIAHIGDTGVMIYRNYQLTQLTDNHTMDGDMRRNLGLDKTAILPLYYQDILTKCFGISSNLEASLYRHKLQKGDKLLFFSDGLTKVIDDEILCVQMQDAPTPELLANALVRLSNLKGSPDNVTVIAVYVE